ncbi:MAG: hypothetical protein LBS31_01040 [Candidatus Adiutrix sp.]|jgi:tRNA (guanine-N7-)-methyltransferase|nr:hypothetical protein [Candidatus Adiutrix sp.]
MVGLNEYLALQEEQLRQFHGLAAERLRASQLDAAIRGVERQIEAQRSGSFSEVLNELDDLNRQTESLRQELTKARDLGAKQVLYAPVKGKVKRLAANTVGGVVEPAQVLMEIVPVGEIEEASRLRLQLIHLCGGGRSWIVVSFKAPTNRRNEEAIKAAKRYLGFCALISGEKGSFRRLFKQNATYVLIGGASDDIFRLENSLMTAFSKKYYKSLLPLVKPTRQPRPTPWPYLFGRKAPLELEIGFGNGEYLNRASQEAPQRDYVGVEIAWASIKRALRRLADPPRANVRLMRLKAETALERCFAPQSLDVIRALFPVPWPDERQEKKRLFSTGFLNLAASRLKPEGRFILVTDSRELAEWTLAQAAPSALRFALAERPAMLDTKYERKWQGGGQGAFFHLDGLKKGPAEIPPTEEAPMQAYYLDDFDPDAYKPRDYVGDVVVRFREFIFDRDREEGLVRVFVVEGPLTQDFHIRIRRQGERWKVSPAIAAELFPTLGLARALELAATPGAGN